MLNSRSWPALGLEAVPNIEEHRAAGVYTHEGHPITLLRAAIGKWNDKHEFQACHILAVKNGYHAAPTAQVACCIASWMHHLHLQMCTPASCAKTAECGLLAAVHPSLNCLKPLTIDA